MLFFRQVWAFFLPLLLLACNFAPVYGTNTALMDQVAYAEPLDKRSYDFTGRLRERLGDGGGNAPYRLSYGLSQSSTALALSESEGNKRFQILGTASWVLTRAADGVEVASGDVERFIGYSVVDGSIAQFAAEEDAIYRVMRLLADDIATQILAQLGHVAQ